MLSVIGRFPARLICGCVCALALTAMAVSHSAAQTGGRSSARGRSQSKLVEPGSLLSQLRDDNLLDELEVSDEQRAKFQEIRQEFGQIFFAPGTEDEKKEKLKDLDAKAVDLLTDDQKATWEKRKAELIAQAGADGGDKPSTEKSVGNEKSDKKPGDQSSENLGTESAPAKTAGPDPKSPMPTRSARIETPPPGAKVTASFKSETADADDDAIGPNARFSFNFQYAPWKDVLELFAKKADLSLDLEDVPNGTFSYRDSQSYTPTEALDVLNGYLIPRGYVLIRRDRFLVCAKLGDANLTTLAPKISIEELAERGKNELVSVVIPLRGLQANVLVEEVKQLLSPQGKALPLTNSNALSVTDFGSHVRMINALYSSESAVDTRDTVFKSIPLKHISAGEAERMVRRLFGLNSTTTVSAGQPQQAVPQQQQQQPQWGNWGGGGWGGGGWGGGGGGWGGRRRGGGGNDDQQDQQQQQQQQPQAVPAAPQVATSNTGAMQFANKIQIAADSRTNNLLVIASAALVAVVEDAVKEMDTNLDRNGNEIVRVDLPVTLKTYTITGGDVASVSQAIDQMVPGVIIGQDTRLSKLYVSATADEHAEVAKLISEFSSEGSGTVAVIPILKKDPVTLCNTLLSLYSKEGARAPTMEADPVGRLIIVRGTPDQVQQVRTILKELGEGGEAAQENVDRGNVRTLTLGGRDPDELLPLLKGSWTATRPNPIRIVVPSRPSPIRERVVPGADRRTPRVRDRVSQSERTTRTFFRAAALETDLDEEEQAEAVASDEKPLDAEPATENAAETNPSDKSDEAEIEAEQPVVATKGKSAPISVEILGDQIVITSEDKQALDRIEELYDRLSGIVPPRTKWHVFYLRTADATEAAQMVERLFPQSNVATSTSSSGGGLLGSLAGGVGSIGRGLMNVSGLDNTLKGSQSLKVVTDIRANALFVSGPQDQVTEVEQILEVLDASELPSSLRDRVPRSIPVEHADVEEVAEIVEDLFKDAMTPENQMPGGARGGMNPFMMLMGGAQPQQGGRRQPTVQLTVGVDTKTNHLLVSCSDSLFQQVESVVQEYDERARKSRQTVKVVRLNQADPAIVTQTLGSLMPKITVGSTLRPRQSNSGNDNAPNDPQDSSRRSRRRGGDASGGNNDAMREAMMRQMMQEGGGGRGGAGRGGFGRGRGGN